MSSEIVLDLTHRRNNSRNSEGAFIDLADGRLMFAYTRFYGSNWSDLGAATICAHYSSDGGKTWTSRHRVLVGNEGELNVASVSLLRMRDRRLGLFYLRMNHLHDSRLYLRTSSNEGKTWSDPHLCTPAPGYFVVNNDRVIRLASGRLLVPAAYHRPRLESDPYTFDGWDWRGLAIFFYSDDDGLTWRESDDWWGLPVPNRSGLQEPGVVELKDGSLYAWARTDTGRQWQMHSDNHGKNWAPPQPSIFRSPCSPLSIKRIPSTGDLLAVWNDHSRRWKRPRTDLDVTWGRTPLAIALSTNDGKLWSRHRFLEQDANRGFCYTAMHFSGDHVLFAYCNGGEKSGVLQDSCIRRVSLDWLYR